MTRHATLFDFDMQRSLARTQAANCNQLHLQAVRTVFITDTAASHSASW